MDKRGGATETENGDAFLELNRTTTKYPHRYTKVSSLSFPLGVVRGTLGPRSRVGGGGSCKGNSEVKAEKPLPGLGVVGWYQMSSLLNAMQLCNLVLDMLLIPTTLF